MPLNSCRVCYAWAEMFCQMWIWFSVAQKFSFFPCCCHDPLLIREIMQLKYYRSWVFFPLRAKGSLHSINFNWPSFSFQTHRLGSHDSKKLSGCCFSLQLPFSMSLARCGKVFTSFWRFCWTEKLHLKYMNQALLYTCLQCSYSSLPISPAVQWTSQIHCVLCYANRQVCLLTSGSSKLAIPNLDAGRR